MMMTLTRQRYAAVRDSGTLNQSICQMISKLLFNCLDIKQVSVTNAVLYQKHIK